MIRLLLGQRIISFFNTKSHVHKKHYNSDLYDIIFDYSFSGKIGLSISFKLCMFKEKSAELT